MVLNVRWKPLPAPWPAPWPAVACVPRPGAVGRGQSWSEGKLRSCRLMVSCVVSA
jgi:hypothetical protein